MGAVLAGNALIALAAAALWGVGDFSGGMGVKTAGGSPRAALRLILASHSTSLTILLIIVWYRADPFPHGLALLCGIAAGLVAALSLAAFYVALAGGVMGASAAISGLLAAAIPAVVSGVIQGNPGPRKLIGFLIAGLAIWLIAASPPASDTHAAISTHPRSSLWLSIAAGAGFGIYFVLLRYAGAAGVVWPMATARMGSVSTCAILLLVLPATGAVAVDHKVLAWILGTATFDTAGNLLFVAATRAGRLDVAAVLASLYPASTILLAAWLLRERPTPRQLTGMAVATAAVVLIAA